MNLTWHNANNNNNYMKLETLVYKGMKFLRKNAHMLHLTSSQEDVW